MQSKPKQLRLELAEERIWELLKEESRNKTVSLLSRLLLELWKETLEGSSDEE